MIMHLDEDIFSNDTRYFFSIHGLRFDYMNQMMAKSLERRFGRTFKSISILNAQPAKIYEDINFIVLNTAGDNTAKEIGKPAVLLVDYEDTNVEFCNNKEIQKESSDIYECDNVYSSQFIYRSQDIHFSKNIVCSDGIRRSEYVACSQRSDANTYSIRVEDSSECSNSFNVIWSGKIANSLFISDCYNMFECMFCSHMSGKRFWIANMPFEEEEYRKLKKMVVEWILTS